MRRVHRLGRLIGSCLVVALVAGVGVAVSAPGAPGKPDTAAVVGHWTPERRAQAIPRDLVLDERGLGYLQLPSGELRPYGHGIPARRVPAAKPGGGGAGGGADVSGPAVTAIDPAAGAAIGASHTFGATVTDASGVRSVTFVVRSSDGLVVSYAASRGTDDRWTAVVSGLDAGAGSWYVIAKDNARRGGNTTTTGETAFTVTAAAGGGGGGDATVTNAAWTGGGAVQTAAGRIYFEMPSNAAQTLWAGYVCSGTAVTDERSDASVILTAAHCVFDDVDEAFARNVMFIPNQADTTGGGTDRDCTNDPLGCWVPTHGVVDSDWASRTWPANIPWDYGYYVVPAEGAHQGMAVSSTSLEEAAGTMPVSFSTPQTGTGSFTHGLGYSYSEDPAFMYCAEGLGTQGSDNWWLSQCGLTGGSSGGPWVQPLSGGSGPVISVNSWKYSGQAGMAGPRLAGTSAACLFTAAQNATLAVTNRGVIPSGC